MSESSGDESCAHSHIVNDWESLLAAPSEEKLKEPGLPGESMRSVRKLYKSKLRNIDDAVNAGTEALSVDSIGIRQRLAQKWSDLKGVSAKNIKLLHEQNPQSTNDISIFFSSTLKLLPNNRDERKQLSHFLISFATTCSRVLTEIIDNEVSSIIAHEVVTGSLRRRAMAIGDNVSKSARGDCSMSKRKTSLHLPMFLGVGSSNEPSYSIEDEFM